MISVRSSLLKGSLKTLSLICFGITLFISQSAISIAADYPPSPAPSLSPAPLPSPTTTPTPAPSPTRPAPVPTTPAPVATTPAPVATTPAPVATTPAQTPTSIPLPPPITLPPVTAPVQVVVVVQNQPPAAPPVAIPANAASQVTIDGKFVAVNVAPQESPPAGTVGVAVVGDGFTFSLGTTSTDGGNTTAGSVTIIDGQPALNTAQQTTLTTSGSGFKPNDQVAVFVFSTATFLGNVKTNGVGEFNASIKLPDLPLGAHHLQATGVTKDGKSRTINLLLNITAPPTKVNKAKTFLPLLELIILLLIFWLFLLLFRNLRENKEVPEDSDMKKAAPNARLNSDEFDDINAKIEAMVKRQALSKKRATVKKKAAAKKAAVRKKSSKV